jgi:hypothetical protein
MPTVKTLEFANVTLNFGPQRIMADLLDEVVLPALTDATLQRKYGPATYFFHNAQKLNLGTRNQPVPAVGATFIKDTTIRREQIRCGASTETYVPLIVRFSKLQKFSIPFV